MSLHSLRTIFAFNAANIYSLINYVIESSFGNYLVPQKRRRERCTPIYYRNLSAATSGDPANWRSSSDKSTLVCSRAHMSAALRRRGSD